MRRDEALHLLQNHKAELLKQFGVIRLALFGSTARDAAGPGSDIDILIAFDGPATSKRYFGAQFYLGVCPRIGAVARESWFDSDFSII
ncbi:MAG: hypothetical protein GY792_09730 [Gammaproteobacteria bacterium]|nr:hypothetical protein [Gammaproteobacteria bacterium]